MKRILFLLAVCVSFVGFGEDWMYWTVDSSGAGIEFFGANLYAVTTEGGVQSSPQLIQSQYNMSLDSQGQWTYAEATTLQNPAECPTSSGFNAFMTDIEPYGVQSAFYVELINLQGAVVGFWSGDYVSRDDLFNMQAVNGFRTQTSTPASFAQPWIADQFSSVPEPTGGVLVLLGGIVLMLRRPHEEVQLA